MAKHHTLGKIGEDLAVNYLKKNGYKILERNYFYARCEIDIIALKNNTLAAVEVKTRSTDLFGRPADFLKPAQIKNLVKAINHYVEKLNKNLNVRFDIISIQKSSSGFTWEHIEDAFSHF